MEWSGGVVDNLASTFVLSMLSIWFEVSKVYNPARREARKLTREVTERMVTIKSV